MRMSSTFIALCPLLYHAGFRLDPPAGSQPLEVSAVPRCRAGEGGGRG